MVFGKEWIENFFPSLPFFNKKIFIPTLRLIHLRWGLYTVHILSQIQIPF